MLTTAQPSTPKARRHCYSAWPHSERSLRACKLCCADLAAEFAAEEARLLERLASDDEAVFRESEALPF